MLRIVAIGLLFSMSTLADQALIDQVDTRQEATLPEGIDEATQQAMGQSNMVMEAFSKSTPTVPGLPQGFSNLAPSPGVDIGELSRQGKALTGLADEETIRYESQILIFISASMPEKAIENYMQSSARIEAALVLRGFIDNSLAETREFLSRLIMRISNETTQVEPTILIDPTLYERFKVDSVPSIVVTESQIKPCLNLGDCPVPVYHKVGGDVALSWALDYIARQVPNDQLKTTLRPLVKEIERL